jgi:hypothetical protein
MPSRFTTSMLTRIAHPSLQRRSHCSSLVFVVSRSTYSIPNHIQWRMARARFCSRYDASIDGQHSGGHRGIVIAHAQLSFHRKTLLLRRGCCQLSLLGTVSFGGEVRPTAPDSSLLHSPRGGESIFRRGECYPPELVCSVVLLDKFDSVARDSFCG